MRLPPASLALLLTLPIWLPFGFVMAGWLGVGVVLMVLGTCQLGIALLSEQSRRPPRYRAFFEEEVAVVDRRMRMRLRRREYVALVKYRAAQRRAA